MKKALIVSAVLAMTGCADAFQKQEPICTAQAMVGGQQTTVDIYGVKKVANQTHYRAGYPFNWKWVSKSNFSSTTCDK